MAAVTTTSAGRPSTPCPRSSRRSTAAFRCWSISGFRRGTDIVKALALGARAVCIGRPYLWGLGAFGQAGVERVLDLLQQETRAAMQQVGARALKQSGRRW